MFDAQFTHRTIPKYGYPVRKAQAGSQAGRTPAAWDSRQREQDGRA